MKTLVVTFELADGTGTEVKVECNDDHIIRVLEHSNIYRVRAHLEILDPRRVDLFNCRT